jgi:quercetin dioxygenase-like cupin family protein
MHRSNEAGFHRSFSESVEGRNFRAHVIVVPEGQASPPHVANCEHIMFQLEGSIAFEFEGARYVTEQYDTLFIPPNIAYGYRNVGSGDALFLSIVGRYDEWPARGTFL